MLKTYKKLNKTTNKRKTKKAREKGIILKMNTPAEIDILSRQIQTELNSIDTSLVSYSPSINDKLITLKTIEREKLENCNNEEAFALKEPLKISVNHKCYLYNSKTAKQFLLKNLAANKHVDPLLIIPPIQSQSNCWFNTMFVTLFVSDKGRKFFHFFRQLMIEGVKSNNEPIPNNLKNGLALLNYSIDSCLTGNEFAYKMDTNTIINDIYKNIPSNYKDNLPYISNVKEAGNPIRYYGSLIFYLHDESIQLAFISSCTNEWKKELLNKLKENDNLNPHVIVLEFFDNESKVITNKKNKFKISNIIYKLDSCVIRNTKGHHFCSLLTCEKNEYAYDGMSFHRLVPLSWKKQINNDFTWRFEGSVDSNNRLLEWNFRSGYQMLVYYRVN
jgi:hypothetical protein